MDTTTYVGLSRLVALQRQTEMTAHNIANANTPGFKASRMLFSDYLVTQHRVTQPIGARPVQFVQDRGTHRDFSPAAMQKTENPLDIALGAEGFLVFATDRGERYGRNGRLAIDPEGRLVGSDGSPVLSEAGAPIVVAPTDVRISIAPDGTVSTENGPIGRLRVVRFEDPQALKAEGANLYAAEEAPVPVAEPKIAQGMVEEANVEPVVELVTLMTQLREFQFTTQLVEQEGERRAQAIERLTRRRS
ncbi:flagellar basal-body rod protein FlgF [Elioraea thermophila]|uniref:flagellar basal-body rod protein FlgF n=1 Tax=Elioraea thermophila TaxID=2185104 RepID=UPI000DF4C79D|nr:flagellar basal-body rod protein FlgF [Elioraea thermophila]